jgi:hypothetical protein
MKTAVIIWMVLFLFWLPIEDTTIWASAALALGLTIGLAFRFALNRSAPSWANTFATGALLGASLPLLTIFLMAFKSGLHAHGFADFTLRQLSVVLYSIPFTILIGLLIAALTKLKNSRGAQAKSKV